MIAMLGHSEINMEVSDAGMEAVESNDYREVSRNDVDDGDANSMLATMREEARFFCKDSQKFIDLFT